MIIFNKMEDNLVDTDSEEETLSSIEQSDSHPKKTDEAEEDNLYDTESEDVSEDVSDDVSVSEEKEEEDEEPVPLRRSGIYRLDEAIENILSRESKRRKV